MFYKVSTKYCTGLPYVQWHEEQIHLDNVSVHISDDFLISRMFNIDYYQQLTSTVFHVGGKNILEE